MPFLPTLGFTASGLILSLMALPSIAEDDPSQRLVVEPFPRATLVDSSIQADADHAVVIGSIRRINNQLRAEREVRTLGELIRATYQIPTEHGRQEAFEHAKEQLLDQPGSMLFFCEGRECGSSSLWANQVLGNARLYGPEDNQAYIVVQLDDEPQRFVSLYAITRGNRRVYVHVEQFTPAQAVTETLYPTPATLLKLLNKDGEVLVPADMAAQPESADAWLHLVNRMLRSDTRLRISVSGDQAPAAVQQLVDLGIRNQRLEVGESTPQAALRINKL
ncbi:DUF4892 domain-containing protein [Halopseudomonas pelagia]|uniref:DUF4892 domain-containing protein n=1 Tax=Halopseudomonas pelagia TaxID=553151 RepID=UPI0003A03D7B|nr:DUF4892 domain-containing protein [Halopseudomonas pelagia]|tara:strand:- start:674 stop:1504 length:831 start_codon:yes stop_codon:yes gene_type:complete